MADTPSPDDAIFGDKKDEPIGGTPVPPPPPPPPPPTGGPVEPPVPGRGSSVINDAFTWAIEAFRQNAGVYVGLSTIVFALKLAQGIAGSVVVGDQPAGSSLAATAAFGLLVISGILGTVFAVLSALASIGVYRAALRRTQGVPPSFDQMMTGENLGRFVVVSILLGLMVGIGLVLCFAPGLLALFFFVFAPYFALDKGYGPRDAFRASSRLVLDNLGTVFVAGLIAILANLLSGLIYGLLTLVMLPFSALFTAYVYRRVQGEPVTP